MNSLDRAFSYLISLFAFPIAGFSIGLAYFDRLCDENDPEVTECDLGGYYGFVGGAIGLGAFVLLLLVLETAAALQSRARS